MANTIVAAILPAGWTSHVIKLYQGDTLLNTGGDSLTAGSNNTTRYTATVTENVTGDVYAEIENSSGTRRAAFMIFDMVDDTGTYVCEEHRQNTRKANVVQWLGTAAATPTVAGVPEVDITHLGGVAQSATDLKAFADNCYDPSLNRVKTDMIYTNAAVNDSSATTTSFVSTITILPDDAIKDLLISFTSGALIGQTKPIQSYNTTTDLITVSEAFTEAPGDGDTFDIIRIHVHPVTQIAQAVWDAAATALTTVGSIGKWILDKLDVVVSTRSSHTAANVRTEMDANSSKLASIETDTQDIQTRLPAALTGDGMMMSDTLYVNGTGQSNGDINLKIDSRASQTSVDDLPTNSELATAIADALTATVADSVPADGSRPSIASGVYLLTQMLTEFAISGTTLTVYKPDGTTALMTFTLSDATNPTALTRAT